MNKSFKRVLLLLAVVCMVCALFTAVAESSAAECVHSYKTVQTFKVGDCETKGIYKKQCTECGDVQYISELGHKMVESYVDADCYYPTRVGSVCAVCGWFDKDALVPVANSQKLDHDLVEVVVESNCEHAGGVMGICSRCDHWEMVYEDPADPKENHEYRAYVKEPTCVEIGYAEGAAVKCQKCGKLAMAGNSSKEPVALPINPANHANVVVDEVLQHGNCLAGTYDVVTLVCKDCGASCGRESRVAEHDWDVEVLEAVDCGNDGLENWVCKVCGLEKLEEVIPATGKHDFKDMAIPADCETPEKYGSVCIVCGAVNGTPVTVVGSQPLGHDWVEELITTDDDCLYKKDAIVGHCSRCDATKLLHGEAKQSAEHINAAIPAVPPTCSTPGWTQGIVCLKCNVIITKPEVDPALGKVEAGTDHSKHDNLVETVYTAADCDSDGLSKFVCTACGWTETKVVKADHKWVDTVIQAATCVADGFKNRECSVCGVKEWNVKIDKTGVHNFEKFYEAATCDTNAKEGVKCTMCGALEYDLPNYKSEWEIAGTKLNHKYETTVFVSEENCIYLIGTTYEICSLCGHENPVATTREDGKYYRDAQHHNWVDIADVDATCVTPGFTGKKICSRCYKVEVAEDGGETAIDPINGHDFIFVVSKEADCKNDVNGQGKKVCQLCGFTTGEYETINHDDAHKYEREVVKAPTCVALGKAVYTCSVCGGSYEEEIGATGEHVMEDVMLDADCYNAARIGEMCKVCGYGEDKLTVVTGSEALGHDIIETVVEKSCKYAAGVLQTCSRCDWENNVPNPGEVKDEHAPVAVPDIDPTCSTTGWTGMTKCSKCGEVLVEGNSVPKNSNAHKWEVEVVLKAADCNAETDGIGKFTCSLCDKSGYTYRTIEWETAHKWVETVIKEANCGEAGRIDKVCSVCGDKVKETLEATGKHNYQKVHLAADCLEAERYTTMCLVCGHETGTSYVAGSQALGHKWVDTLIEKATCDYPAGVLKTCSVCGEIEVYEVDGKKVDLTAYPKHLGEKELDAVPETCQASGLYGKKVCTVCGDVISEGTIVAQDPTKHVKGEPEILKPADCVNNTDGIAKYACKYCGVDMGYGVIDDTDAKYAHNFVVTETTDPTCVKEGKKISVCSLCNEKKTDPIPATGNHNYVNKLLDADCENPARFADVCSVCGGETNVVPVEGSDALGHDIEEVLQQADCYNPYGVRRYCTRDCGYDEVEAIKDSQGEVVQPALNHEKDGVSGIVWKTIEATCHTPKMVYDYCTICEKALREPVQPGDPANQVEKDENNHVWVFDAYVEEATCTHPGTARYICKYGCDGAKSFQTYTVDHTYSEVEKIDTLGTLVYTDCTVCGNVKVLEVLTAVGCANAAHNFVAVEGTPATNDVDGITDGVKCSVCGLVLSGCEKIPARHCKHVEESIPAVDPTCTETGLTEGKKCSLCDMILVEQKVVDALAEGGHTEEEIPAVAATCTETGLTAGKKCSVCGEIIDEQEVVEALGHTEEEIPAVDPTCTETGLTAGVKCSVCDIILEAQEEVPALGHTEEEIPAVAPTCAKAGLTAGTKCSVCGEILKAQEEVAALPHTEEEIPAVAADCVNTGLTAGIKCTVCGEIVKAQEVVPALGHKEEVVAGKAATCTEAGLTDGAKCTVCGETTKEQVAIEALGHTEVALEAVAPTCDETGLTAGVKCSVCEVILEAQEEVAALGHKYTVSWDFNEDFTKKVKISTCDVCGDVVKEEMDF